jgi:hypothetical protein
MSSISTTAISVLPAVWLELACTLHLYSQEQVQDDCELVLEVNTVLFEEVTHLRKRLMVLEVSLVKRHSAVLFHKL